MVLSLGEISPIQQQPVYVKVSRKTDYDSVESRIELRESGNPDNMKGNFVDLYA